MEKMANISIRVTMSFFILINLFFINYVDAAENNEEKATVFSVNQKAQEEKYKKLEEKYKKINDEVEKIDREILKNIKEDENNTKEAIQNSTIEFIDNILKIEGENLDLLKVLKIRKSISAASSKLYSGNSIKDIKELEVVIEAISLLNDLKRIEVKTDHYDLGSPMVFLGDIDDIEDIAEEFWDILDRTAKTKKFENTQLSKMGSREKLVWQMIGPYNGKISVFELIANIKKKEMEWRNIKLVDNKKRLITSATPICFDIKKSKRGLLLKIEGKNLEKFIKDNTMWLTTVAKNIQIVVKESNSSKVETVTKLLPKENVFVLINNTKKEQVTLYYVDGKKYLGIWDLRDLHSKSNIVKFINTAIGSLNKIDHAKLKSN